MGISTKQLAEMYRRMGHKNPVQAACGPGGFTTNKYGVAPKDERTVDNIVFASKREAWRYRELKVQLDAGLISDLKLQPKFEIHPAYVFPGCLRRIKAIHYIGDFQYIRDGQTIIEDVKGVETRAFLDKAKMFRARYPDLTLEVVK